MTYGRRVFNFKKLLCYPENGVIGVINNNMVDYKPMITTASLQMTSSSPSSLLNCLYSFGV
jgi:hypothetical protein